MFEIKSDIPPPPKKGYEETSELTDTARAMKVGDSILVPYTRKYPYASNMRRRTGFEFVQKKEGDMLRIWRIK